MATSTTSDEHANLLENFIDNVRAALAQIEEGETKKQNPKDFNPDVYWKKFGDVFKALSHEATKLSMAFSSPPAPSPEALEGLLGSFEKAVLALVSFYYTLPKRQGITLRKVVRKSVMRCLESVIILVENLKQGNTGNSEQLQSTGALWQEVDNFSNIPRDNKSAVLEVLKRNMHLVSDALQELDQALEIDGEDEGMDEFLANAQNHGNNASSWSDRDKDIVVSCLPLIKASKSILKKTHAAVRMNGRCSSEEEISQLDDLGDYIESMSPKVDEFATSLYPPLKGPNVLQQLGDRCFVTKHWCHPALSGHCSISAVTAPSISPLDCTYRSPVCQSNSKVSTCLLQKQGGFGPYMRESKQFICWSGQSSRVVAAEMGVRRTQIQGIIKCKRDIIADFENNVNPECKRLYTVTPNE